MSDFPNFPDFHFAPLDSAILIDPRPAMRSAAFFPPFFEPEDPAAHLRSADFSPGVRFNAGPPPDGPWERSATFLRMSESDGPPDDRLDASDLDALATAERLPPDDLPFCDLLAVLEIGVDWLSPPTLLRMSESDGRADDHLDASGFDAVATAERLPPDDLPAVLEIGVDRLRLSSLLRVSERVGRLIEGPNSDGAGDAPPADGLITFVLPPFPRAVDRASVGEFAADGAPPGAFALHRLADRGVEVVVLTLGPLTRGAVYPCDFVLERALGACVLP